MVNIRKTIPNSAIICRSPERRACESSNILGDNDTRSDVADDGRDMKTDEYQIGNGGYEYSQDNDL